MSKFTYTTRKDGRLMKRVSVNGQLQTIYANDPKTLEKKYIELKYLDNKGLTPENNSITLSQWTDIWFKTYKKNIEQATKNMYKNSLKLILNDLGNYKLKQIKETDILSLLNKYSDKPRTKEIIYITLNQILEKAVDNDYIYKNVCKKIELKRYKSPEKKPLSENEILLLKQVCETDTRCFMILFMLYTGIRKEEVVPIKFSDINFKNKTLTINKAVHWKNNQATIKTTKNTESRIIPIPDIIYKKLPSNYNKDALLFPSSTNKLRSETSMKRTLEYTLKQINNLSDTLDTPIKFTYHQLRHTYACFLHKAGISVKEAQYFMGHKTINVLLNIYTHLDNQDKQNATDKLNNLLNI